MKARSRWPSDAEVPAKYAHPDMDQWITSAPCALKEFEEHEDWLDGRRLTVGSSDMSLLLEQSKYGGPYDLYMDKLGELEPQVQTEDLRRGKIHERAIMQITQEDAGLEHLMLSVQPYWLLRHKKHKVHATPDGIVWSEEHGVEPLEVKDLRSSIWADQFDQNVYGIPTTHLIQCQTHIFVMGVKSCVFGWRMGDNHDWTRVPRHDGFQKVIAKKADHFIRRHVEARNPPAGHRSLGVLKRLFPREVKGKEVELPKEAALWWDLRESTKKRIARQQKMLEELETLIRENMEDAERGALLDGRVLTLKRRTRKAHEVAESSWRELKLARKQKENDDSG